MVIAPFLVTAAMALQASPPAAAPDRPRGYGFLSVTFARHPPSQVYYRSVITPLSGNGWDFAAGGGVFVSTVFAVEGELLYGGVVSTPQYVFFDEKGRDVLLSALARYRPASMPRLQLVAGGGSAWTRTWQDPKQSGSPPVWWHAATVTFGADVVVLDARHAAVAPSFRVRWVNRDLDFGDGLGKVTYQIGATLFLR